MISPESTIAIVPFERRFDRTQFSCGKHDLDDWLQRFASQSEKRDTTRTFVAVSGSRVVGYYATRTYELDLDEAAEAFGVGRRPYPVPATLLARLAVDQDYQGRGLGGRLLVDALGRLSEASLALGFEVVVVHAIDAEASTFYRRWGFQPFEERPLHLFLATKDLRASFAAAQP